MRQPVFVAARAPYWARDYEPVDEVALGDIPLPLGSQAYGQAEQERTAWIVRFDTTYDMQSLRTFYTYEMERLGWRVWAHTFIQGQEGLLVFKKPSRACIIALSPSGAVTIRVCVRASGTLDSLGQHMAQAGNGAGSLYEDEISGLH